jgi:hypothetical protein
MKFCKKIAVSWLNESKKVVFEVEKPFKFF